jgi:DNA-binding response OmpR family regulator
MFWRLLTKVEERLMPMPDSKIIPFDRKKCLLLIEDDKLVLEGMALALGKNGFTIHTAATAEEALLTINLRPYDGIICDYHLPGMNGLDFFRKAGARLFHSTNILMTAFGFDQIVRHTSVLGIDAFCEKPFTIQSLISVLNSGKMRPGRRVAAHVFNDRLPISAANAVLEDH